MPLYSQSKLALRDLDSFDDTVRGMSTGAQRISQITNRLVVRRNSLNFTLAKNGGKF